MVRSELERLEKSLRKGTKGGIGKMRDTDEVRKLHVYDNVQSSNYNTTSSSSANYN